MNRHQAQSAKTRVDLPAKLPRYSVSAARRKPLVDFMLDALKASGCTILYASSPDVAPFVLTFETPGGERMGVVAYAFLATRTPTKNRPQDERSFQIKYGTKRESNEHSLWQDRLGLFTTLLIGIDPEEGFFVAADPVLHSPTKFYIRLEFKDRHADEIKRSGWHAWERDRRAGNTHPIEVLVGGTKDSLLDLIRFERAALGLAPGDRHLLAERPNQFGALSSAASSESKEAGLLHPLAAELNLSPSEILDLIAAARRLKMAVRGWVAEKHLEAQLIEIPGVSDCRRSDQEGGPDIFLRYRSGLYLSIECKNALRKLAANGNARIDFQRTRASKSDPCSRYYSPKDFDIVAGCLHAVSEKWEFRYSLAGALPPHLKCQGRLSSNVQIGDSWRTDVTLVLQAANALGLGRERLL